MDISLKKSIQRGIRISVTLVVITLFVVLLLTVERETFRALTQLRPLSIFGLFFLWAMFIVLDGLRLSLLTKAGETPISLRRAVEVNLVGYFFAAVTPFQTGGFPFQVLLLKKDRISPGRAMAYLSLRGLLIYGPIYLLAPIFILAFSQIAKRGIIQLLLNYLVVVLVGLGFLIFLAFLKPERTETLVSKIRPKLSKRIASMLDFLLAEVEEFRLSFGQIRRHQHAKRLLTLVLGVSIAALTLYLFIAPSVLIALGSPDVHIGLTMALQAVLMALLLFVPTPGAGGIAEMGGLALFSLVAPKYLLGIFVILWRFFTFYLSAIVGGVIALKEF